MIREISRRCSSNNVDGIACGPVSLEPVVCEVILEDEGKKIFLTGSWINECSDEIQAEVTSESIYDIMLCIDDDMEKLNRLREEAPKQAKDYSDIFEIMIDDIKKEIFAQGYIDPDDYDEDDEFELSVTYY